MRRFRDVLEGTDLAHLRKILGMAEESSSETKRRSRVSHHTQLVRDRQSHPHFSEIEGGHTHP